MWRNEPAPRSSLFEFLMCLETDVHLALQSAIYRAIFFPLLHLSSTKIKSLR